MRRIERNPPPGPGLPGPYLLGQEWTFRTLISSGLVDLETREGCQCIHRSNRRFHCAPDRFFAVEVDVLDRPRLALELARVLVALIP